MTDLDARLRRARPSVEPPAPEVTASVERALLDAFAGPRPRRVPRWIRRRAAIGALACGALAATVAVVVVRPWSDGPEVRVTLGGDRPAPASEGDTQPPYPIGAGDLPARIRALRDRIDLRTLRRRVVLRRSDGDYGLWTFRYAAGDPLESRGEVAVALGPNTAGGAPPETGCPDIPADSALTQCAGGRDADALFVGGRSVGGVARVTLEVGPSVLPAANANGYWIGVLDRDDGAFRVHAFDRSGGEVATVQGRDPATGRVVTAPPSDEPTVPNLLGASVDEARAELERLGLAVRVESLPEAASVPYVLVAAGDLAARQARVGEVVRQDPDPGSALTPGATVALSTVISVPTTERLAQGPPPEQADSPDVPPAVREFLRRSVAPVAPGALVRRRIAVDRSDGRWEVWTSTVNPDPASAPAGTLIEMVELVRDGEPEGGSTGTVLATVSGLPAAALGVGGAAGGPTVRLGTATSEVGSVSALYGDGEGRAELGAGYWMIVTDQGRGEPVALIVRDRDGREIGRLAGTSFWGELGTAEGAARAGTNPPPPGQVSVPDITGLTPDEASRRVAAAGLSLQTIDGEVGVYDPGTAPNRVVGQRPEAGSTMRSGATVVAILGTWSP